MSTPAKSVYVMIKEQRVAVPIDFNRDLTLESFVTFHKPLKKKFTHEKCRWPLKVLKTEQKRFLRSPGVSYPNLASLVNPRVIRLNEAKHVSIVAATAQ
ncbi:hypothetical protein BCV72DRAFT_230012 [Rhizopus microsporus var. microsporus]|uniref:Uncharacterized protein n=1 Tax=Rhizopus microsporus var. microsporus TaxID=86635 RepID=A0A1X0R071_RHIZD|nr:hypothetical protein BCV72DRAFT_230012 [Rhizopus microsporus var. microsporus]